VAGGLVISNGGGRVGGAAGMIGIDGGGVTLPKDLSCGGTACVCKTFGFLIIFLAIKNSTTIIIVAPIPREKSLSRLEPLPGEALAGLKD
jgi:hypothetical protein